MTVCLLRSRRLASLLKALVPTVILLVLASIGLGSSLATRQTGKPVPEVHDYGYTQPFRNSEVGNTLLRACGNCHSNQTTLPWYGHVMPISWWIESHVRDGRQALNLSDWTTYSARRRRDELESICGVISNGRMPPTSYRALHPEAGLRAEQKKEVCVWTANQIEDEK